MQIRVKLYASLRKHLPQAQLGQETILNVSEGQSIRDILQTLQILENEVKIIFVNGTHQTLDYRLREDELLVLFPPVGGG